MWQKTYTTITKEVSKEQLFRLFEDVNNWPSWDESIEFTKLEGKFEKGNFFEFKPKGGPKFKLELVDVQQNRYFADKTKFFLAEMVGGHLFEDTADGLRITTTFTVTGPLTFLWVKLVAQGIVNGLPKEVANQIKEAKKL